MSKIYRRSVSKNSHITTEYETGWHLSNGKGLAKALIVKEGRIKAPRKVQSMAFHRLKGHARLGSARENHSGTHCRTLLVFHCKSQFRYMIPFVNQYEEPPWTSLDPAWQKTLMSGHMQIKRLSSREIEEKEWKGCGGVGNISCSTRCCFLLRGWVFPPCRASPISIDGVLKEDLSARVGINIHDPIRKIEYSTRIGHKPEHCMVLTSALPPLRSTAGDWNYLQVNPVEFAMIILSRYCMHDWLWHV